jgi:MATE family multidrug resistance protein
VWLSRTRGVGGAAAAVWLSDLATAAVLAAYVLFLAKKHDGKAEAPPCGRWWWPEKAAATEWMRLIRLAVPCCLNTCLEWWCYEILVLLTGRLPDARRAVAVIAVTLNFDYLLFAAMLSLSVSASVRVSNSLGAGDASAARRAAVVSIAFSVLAGAVGGALMLALRQQWARLYTRGAEVRDGVAKAMRVMAALEVVNFPLNVCGGIVRGTARPAVGMYAVLGGFYLVALPVGVALGFRARRGIEGLLAGFIVGAAASLAVLVVVIARMDWKAEADRARVRVAVATVQDDLGSCKEKASSGNAGDV